MSPRDPTRRTTKKGRLVDRVIRQRRDRKQDADEAGDGADADEADAGADAGETDDQRRITALERRVGELEALLESLQDSVYRETTRLGREVSALGARTEAPELARALERYSRERGF